MKIFLFALLAAISVRAAPMKFASCETPIPGKHYYIRAIPKEDVNGDEDPFSQTPKKYQTLTYRRPTLERSTVMGGTESTPLRLDKDAEDGYRSLFSVEKLRENDDAHRIYSSPAAYAPGTYVAVEDNPKGNTFKGIDGVEKETFLEKNKKVEIETFEMEDGSVFGIEKYNKKKHMIKNKDGKRFLMSVENPDFIVSWKQTGISNPITAIFPLGHGNGFFTYIWDGPHQYGGISSSEHDSKKEEFKFKYDNTIFFPQKNMELKINTSGETGPMVFAKGNIDSKPAYFCFQSYGKPEIKQKEETKNGTVQKELFSLPFEHLDYERLVGRFGSDTKFIDVCNRKLESSFPNHKCTKCFKAEKGSVMIHFQGDMNLINKIKIFCSTWKTEQILKDSAFASSDKEEKMVINNVINNTIKNEIAEPKTGPDGAASFSFVISILTALFLVF